MEFLYNLEDNNSELIQMIKVYYTIITNVDAMANYARPAITQSLEQYIAALKSRITFLDLLKQKNPDKESISESIQIYHENNAIQNLIDEKKSIFIFLPQSILSILISYYDNFLSNTIKVICLNVPNVCYTITKELPLSAFKFCSSIADIKEYYVDLHIDELMRGSHKNQLKWLEDKLKIEIIKTFNEWKDFILLTEVRNIIVHNNGIINNQFVNSLKSEGIDVDSYQKGKEFDINPDFLLNSFDIIIQLATHIFTCLSKKFYVKESITIDRAINDVCFNYLCRNKNWLVIKLILRQLAKYEKHTSSYEYTYRINCAIAYKRKNENKKMNEILDEMDLSNCDDIYRFANLILREKYEDAISYMDKLKSDEQMLTYYLSWPLFEDFIKTDAFKREYVKIYGNDFIPQLDIISNQDDKIIKEVESVIKNYEKDEK